MKKGLRILIGNGNETDLWTAPWLSTNPPRPPRAIEGMQQEFRVVSDLMNTQHNRWDLNKIAAAIISEDRVYIQRLRLSSQIDHDLLGWHYTSSGSYSVKSGYWLAMHIRENDDDVLPPPGLPEFKEQIWKLQTAPKLKHFLWRMLSNAMPIDTILIQRGIITDPQCRRCCQEEESMHHLFSIVIMHKLYGAELDYQIWN